MKCWVLRKGLGKYLPTPLPSAGVVPSELPPFSGPNLVTCVGKGSKAKPQNTPPFLQVSTILSDGAREVRENVWGLLKKGIMSWGNTNLGLEGPSNTMSHSQCRGFWQVVWLKHHRSLCKRAHCCGSTPRCQLRRP